MTNKEVKKAVKASRWLQREVVDFIWSNYRRAEKSESTNWVCVLLDGNDYKYGRFYVDTEKMLVRNTTFDEFYGGGIVD